MMAEEHVDEEPLVFGGDEAGLGDRETATFVVHPFPLEATVSYGEGTGYGPDAILEASYELEFFCEEDWMPYWEPGAVYTDETPELPEDPATALRVIEECVRQTVDRGQFPLSLGGEHSITYSCVRAVREVFPDCGVLFIDAHLDLRAEYEGTPYSHASVARRIVDELGAPMAWCGIRSVSAEEAQIVDERDYAVIFAHEIPDDPDWITRVIDALPETIYLSIDIDGLDPAYAPGTGTPEPGGLSYRQLLQLLRRLTQERKIAGADIVEVAPIEGQQVTEFTAAKIAAKLFSLLR
ncbi:MAG: agmatinase [Planctomycetes bacterium]|nr:agmatinase [Planctomycetota bacterium]